MSSLLLAGQLLALLLEPVHQLLRLRHTEDLGIRR